MIRVMGKPDLLEIVRDEGIKLKQRGRLWWACCPLHQEKTPSFCINAESQRFKCFGCGTSGDVIDFVQKLKGISFKDALRHLGMSSESTFEQTKNPREAQRRELIKAFNKWCASAITGLCDLIRLGNRIGSLVKTSDDTYLPGLGEMYLQKEFSEYKLSVLSSEDVEARITIFKGTGDEN